jgi:hypothetical protein
MNYKEYFRLCFNEAAVLLNPTGDDSIKEKLVAKNVDSHTDEKVAYIDGKSKAEFLESPEGIHILLIRTNSKYRNQGYAKQLVQYLQAKGKPIETGVFLPKGEQYLRKYFK